MVESVREHDRDRDAGGVRDAVVVAVESVGLRERLGDAEGLGLPDKVTVRGALNVGVEPVGDGGLGVWLRVALGEAEGAVGLGEGGEGE